METIEIPNIETTQYTTLSRGTREMVLICTLDHHGFQSGLHVDAAGTERRDQRLPHRIFVKVQAYRHGVFRGTSCCISRCVASASSAVRGIDARIPCASIC